MSSGFSACGVTPQSVIATVRPNFASSLTIPAAQLVTDRKNSESRSCDQRLRHRKEAMPRLWLPQEPRALLGVRLRFRARLGLSGKIPSMPGAVLIAVEGPTAKDRPRSSVRLHRIATFANGLTSASETTSPMPASGGRRVAHSRICRICVQSFRSVPE
jgi:hypothetical protein